MLYTVLKTEFSNAMLIDLNVFLFLFLFLFNLGCQIKDGKKGKFEQVHCMNLKWSIKERKQPSISTKHLAIGERQR